MYIPQSHAETRPDVLYDFIEAHPLGALVTASTDGLFATHLPLVVDRTRGDHGTLEGHVAKANPHHRQALSTTEALVIFTGPDAYITPSWYPTKTEHGRVVPTWNYVAVHAYGVLRFIEDRAFIRRNLEALVSRHEGRRDRPWALSDAPADYIEKQERAVIGVEIAITRLEGKWKMSQNRPANDIEGVITGLASSADEVDRATADIVAARRPTR